MSDPRIETIIGELRTLGSEHNRAGMARYGISVDRAFGISMASLRPVAKRLGRDHALALELWASGWHEARILAVLIADPRAMTPALMDAWTADFDSWDLCDQAGLKLYVKTDHVEDCIARWAVDERTFVRRAAFALMAAAAVHLKAVDDAWFAPMLERIDDHAGDERNFVKKAVNWALRQIGKRNASLHGNALALAERLAASDDKTRRWVGRNAVRELTDPTQIARIKDRDAKRS